MLAMEKQRKPVFLKLIKALRYPSMKTHQQVAFVFFAKRHSMEFVAPDSKPNPSQDYRDYLAGEV